MEKVSGRDESPICREIVVELFKMAEIDGDESLVAACVKDIRQVAKIPEYFTGRLLIPMATARSLKRSLSIMPSRAGSCKR